MKVMTYNILKGGRGRENALHTVIAAHQPDVVILQEATVPQVVQTLAHRGGFPYYGSQARNSVAFLSRQPIQTYRWHTTPHARSPFLELVCNGWRVFGVHLSALFANVRERRRVHQVRELLALTALYRQTPHIIVGDFNAAAPGDSVDLHLHPRYLRAMVWLNGGIRREALQGLIAAGYIDTFRQLHPSKNGFTLPAFQPNTRLDYGFVPAALAERVRASAVITTPAATRHASDHLPLLITLVD